MTVNDVTEKPPRGVYARHCWVDFVRGWRKGQMKTRTLPLLGLLAAILVASGCSNARRYGGLALSSYNQGELIPLPGITQSSQWQCGYASMASVALYYGVKVDRLLADDLVALYSGKALSGRDLVRMAKMMNLDAFGYAGDLDDLQVNIGKGRPVITLLEGPPRLPGSLAVSFANHGHWVVVIGTTDQSQIVLFDPNLGNIVMDEEQFLDAWNQEQRFCVLVGRPGSDDAIAGLTGPDKRQKANNPDNSPQRTQRGLWPQPNVCPGTRPPRVLEQEATVENRETTTMSTTATVMSGGRKSSHAEKE